jgi:hypothetical protein
MNRSPVRLSFFHIPLVFALTGFALSPTARATCQDACLTNDNTVQGDSALISLTTGTDNTAIGFEALYYSTIGSSNTAIGASALHANTTGQNNAATGNLALFSNTTGYSNTASGFVSLYKNTLGWQNTATGTGALYSNTTGQGNTAEGVSALFSNTTGLQNVAFGASALPNNTTGELNTAIGTAALYNSKSGFYNIAVGYNAGYNIVSGSNNIDIGGQGRVDESGVIRIGNQASQTAAYIAGISDTPLAHGTAVAVGITADGQLGVRASSVRFKEAVKPMDKASEAIFSLQPVTFRYKKDPAALPQFGLVAEEVAKINPDLVARDVEGKPFTVRYDEINAMLLNEFLKEHRKVEQQEATIGQLKEDFRVTVARLGERLEKQASQIQKMNAELEARKSSPQIVLNNQ